MEYVLETNSLTKSYRKFRALSGCSMKIRKGDIYGFIGKNGAGKTTLIRVICGLQLPSEGTYSIYGEDFRSKNIANARRRMGAVVETPSIYLDMTAENNMKTQYDVLGLPSYDGIKEILDFVGLSDTGDKKAKNFSLGMKQRLGIAVALAGQPDFIVLDEPINGLDPQGIVEIRELILKLNRERQITVLISSHILSELSRLATRYGFIDGGRLIKEISAEELESACRKCLTVTSDNVRAAARALDSLKLEYRISGDNEAQIFSETTVTAISDAFKREGCTLLKAYEKDEDLETYFINLIGGAK